MYCRLAVDHRFLVVGIFNHGDKRIAGGIFGNKDNVPLFVFRANQGVLEVGTVGDPTPDRGEYRMTLTGTDLSASSGCALMRPTLPI